MKWTMIAFVILAFASPAIAQDPGVKIEFSPESEKYNQATIEYRTLWNNEGKRMVEAMEKVSGVKFTENEVRAIVYEGISSSGMGNDPMKLRASYPSDVKKATLIHELGHRLLAH
jgi:hypothetical protein